MSRKKKIVFASCIGDINDSHTLLYIKTLKNEGHDLFAIRCNIPDMNYSGILTKYWELKKINTHFWPSGIKIKSVIEAIFARSRNSFILLRILLKNKFDYVVATEPDSLLVAVLSSFIKKHKVVFDLREVFEDRVIATHYLIRPFLLAILKSVLKFCSLFVEKIIHVSNERANYYSYLKNSYEVVIYSPPFLNKLRKYSVGKNDPLIFVHAGALRKNYHSQELVSAFEQLFKKNVNVRLIIIGGIAEKLDNEDILKHLMCNGFVELIEKVPSNVVTEILERAHVGISFVSKIDISHRLAQPRKLYEYIALGLPVIVSKNETISKVVENYYCGWVVDSANIDSITKQISEIENMRSDVSKYGENAYRAHLSNFNWESQAPKLISIFE